MGEQIRQLKQQPQPADNDASFMPCLSQQRADAFVLLFRGKNIDLTTEVVVHVRGDGTPVTDNAVCKRLGRSFGCCYTIWKGSRSTHQIVVTTRKRQKRVVLEAHNHECVDCQSPDLLELDHNPTFEQTRHIVTTELEPRCAPCHRASRGCEALVDVRVVR